MIAPVSPSAFADDVPSPRAAAKDAGYAPYKTKNGVAVERRAVSGSKFFEYRAFVNVQVPPEQVIEQLWNGVGSVRGAPMVKQRKMLKQDASEIVLYDQIKTPVVSDRDYTLRIRKVSNPGSHHYEMIFETANELGPPVDPKHVRIPAIRGAWVVDAGENGGSRLTYRSFSEPGGSIPAFMIHGAQFDQIVHDVERVSEQMKKLAAK